MFGLINKAFIGLLCACARASISGSLASNSEGCIK